MTRHRESGDVAIVGGGIAGCAAALALAKRGLSVILLERREVGSQASGVNFGGVRQQGRHLAELPLSRRARPLWDRLPDLVGHDCEFMATGHLKLAYSEVEMSELETFARDAAEQGLEIELFGRNALREAFDFLGESVHGASLCRSDGQANPRLVAPAFARAARRAGATVLEHHDVTALAWDGNRFRLETATGLTVDATRLVNVAGAWGDRVAGAFGEAVPLELIHPNMQVSEPIPYFLTRNLGVSGGGLYARQIPRGNVIFGGGRGVGERDQVWSRAASDASLGAMQRLMETIPQLAGVQVIRTWSGLEGGMPDAIPVIGASRTVPNLVHAFGFSGHGFQLGPVIGEIVTELLLDGATPTPIDAFAIDRFSGTVEGGAITREVEDDLVNRERGV